MAEPLQLLLCEDNYPDVLYLRKLLDKTGFRYSMHVCEDGKQALDFLSEVLASKGHLPDLVLLDIKVPKYSGLEVLEKIRLEPQLWDLNVVVITGSDDADELSLASNLGASYLKKPADFEKLCQLLSVTEHACFGKNASSNTSASVGIETKPSVLSWGAHTNVAGDVKDGEFRLLLIDDNPRDIRLIQGFLIKSSQTKLFVIEPMHDLESAMARLADRHFDVIALNLVLPDSSGLEGLFKIQRLAPQVPVVIVSDSDDEALGKEAVSRGAQDCIVKNRPNYGEVLVLSLKYAIYRKRAEGLARASLLREQYILQEALAKAPIIVMRVDSNLALVDVNSATEVEFALTRRDLIGQNIIDLIPDIEPEDLTNLIASGLAFQYESYLINTTGSKVQQERFWDVLAWPVHSRGGQVHEAILLASDVTAKVRAGQQRDEFVQTLAHDIKNPVLGQKRFLTSLLKRFGSQTTPPQVADGLSELSRSNESLVLMLTNLLEAYRFEEDLYRPSVASIEVAGLISECLSDMQTFLKASEIITKVHIQSGVLAVEADPIALKRLLQNILHNSIKFIPSGGEIKVEVSTDNVRLIIAISDTGPGLSQEEQALLFQRYAPTASGKRKLHSSGLGLYICKRIVEAHGGTIACSSKLNHGATFTITLPLCQIASPTKPV